MKRILILSTALLLSVAAIASQRLYTLEEVVQLADLIVVARLDGATLKGEAVPGIKGLRTWTGQLVVSSVIRGSAKKGQNLTLKWCTSSEQICPQPVDLSGHKDQSLIWLLKASTKDPVRAFRVLELKQWWELEKLLNKEAVIPAPSLTP